MILLHINTSPFYTDRKVDTYEKGTALASIPSSPAEEPLPLPDALSDEPSYRKINGDLRGGEGLDDSFKRFNLPTKIRAELIQTLAGTLDLKKLLPQDCYSVTLDKNGELVSCTFESGPLSIYTVSRAEEGLKTEKLAIPLELRTIRLTGTMQSSIFATFTELGEEPKLVHEYAGIFASKIDFNTEARQGDRLDLVFEKYFKDNVFVGYGNILYASYTQADKSWQGHYSASDKVPAGYYDEEGEELGTSFLRSPIPFGRVTSGFSYHRKHPITHEVKPHLGIDLAAPFGTPVLAVSEGKVVFIGRKGGFGKTVVLKHAGGYETHYGHLSNYGKGLKVGSRVQQKDVIGFVGSTGVSTGPHLDYRISLNGNFKNPFSLKFKPRYTLSAEELVYFRKEIEKLAALLEESGDLKVLQVKNIVFSEDDPIFLL